MKVSKRIQYPTDEVICFLGKTVLGHYATNYLMMELSAKNETNVAAKGFIKLPDGTIVTKENIVFGGNMDVNSPKDAEEFRALNFTFCDLCPGSFVPAKFDYATCTGEAIPTPEGTHVPRLIETFDPVKMYAFAHAKLGKPKQVVIFKKTTILRD